MRALASATGPAIGRACAYGVRGVATAFVATSETAFAVRRVRWSARTIKAPADTVIEDALSHIAEAIGAIRAQTRILL